MSATYADVPVMSRGSSLRLTSAPTRAMGTFLSLCDVAGRVMVHSPPVSFDLLVGAPYTKPLPGAVGDSAPRPALRFKIDTLAFPNELRALHPEKPDLYA